MWAGVQPKGSQVVDQVLQEIPGVAVRFIIIRVFYSYLILEMHFNLESKLLEYMFVSFLFEFPSYEENAFLQ